MRDRTFNIVKNPKHDGYQRGLASMVHKFLDKKRSSSGVKNKNVSDQQLAEELQKQFIKRFKKRKVQSLFIDKEKKSTVTFYRKYLGC